MSEDFLYFLCILKSGDVLDEFALSVSILNLHSGNFDISYSKFMGQCFKKDVRLNRKMLAELAAREPEVFEKVAKEVMA